MVRLPTGNFSGLSAEGFGPQAGVTFIVMAVTGLVALALT